MQAEIFNNNNKEDFMRNLRWVTPVGVTIAIFLLGIILSRVSSIDTKLFNHLTNREMHTPQSALRDFVPRTEIDAMTVRVLDLITALEKRVTYISANQNMFIKSK